MTPLRLMVLGGGSSQESLLRRARKLGWYVLLVDHNPRAPGRRHADEFVEVSTFDAPGVLQAARRLKPDSLVTVGSDQPVYTCAVVSEELSIPFFLSAKSAEKTTNKRAMKLGLREAGVPTVPFEFLSLDTAPTLPLPLVVKPLDSQGQRGVTLVREEQLFDPAVEEALSFSRESTVLVERYYPSTEVTLSGWVRRGHMEVWSLTDRVTVSPEMSLGVCAAHRFPSIHTEVWGTTVEQYSRRIVATFGIKEGPIYFQFLIGEEGVKANEVACRLGGAYEDESLPLVVGVDPVGEQLALCERLLGREASGGSLKEALLDTPARFFSVPLLFCREGTVASYEGDEAIREMPGIWNCRFLLPVGTRILPMRNSTQRVGYAVVAGGSKEEVNSCITRLFENLAVRNEVGENLLLDFRQLCSFPETGA